MVDDDFEYLKMYLVNEGLRLDSAVVSARYNVQRHSTVQKLLDYAFALHSKQEFDRITSAICRILDV